MGRRLPMVRPRSANGRPCLKRRRKEFVFLVIPVIWVGRGRERGVEWKKVDKREREREWKSPGYMCGDVSSFLLSYSLLHTPLSMPPPPRPTATATPIPAQKAGMRRPRTPPAPDGPSARSPPGDRSCRARRRCSGPLPGGGSLSPGGPGVGTVERGGERVVVGLVVFVVVLVLVLVVVSFSTDL